MSSSLEHSTTRHGAMTDKTQDNITRFYNLDAILAVGFRVRSKQGTLFRQWALEHLKNYLSETELRKLNNVVSEYFDIAENRALDYIAQLKQDAKRIN